MVCKCLSLFLYSPDMPYHNNLFKTNEKLFLKKFQVNIPDVRVF